MPPALAAVMVVELSKRIAFPDADRTQSPSAIVLSGHLKQWARQGIVFRKAFSTAPWTLPSHASILTGRLQPELTVNWFVPLDGTYPTLAETLATRGYATAGFSANTNYASGETGLARGFARFDDYPLSPVYLLRSSALGRSIGRTMQRFGVVAPGLLGRKRAPAVSQPFFCQRKYHF